MAWEARKVKLRNGQSIQQTDGEWLKALINRKEESPEPFAGNTNLFLFCLLV